MAQCKDYSSLHYRLPFEKVWNLTYYFHANHYIPLVSLGLSRGLGCRKGCLGWYLFRPGSWGKAVDRPASSIFTLLTHVRWIQPRPAYWSPSLTSTCQIYKKSMISWSSKSTNLVLIIGVPVSDHHTSKLFLKIDIFTLSWLGAFFQRHLWFHMVIYSLNQTFRVRNVRS